MKLIELYRQDLVKLTSIVNTLDKNQCTTIGAMDVNPGTLEKLLDAAEALEDLLKAPESETAKQNARTALQKLRMKEDYTHYMKVQFPQTPESQWNKCMDFTAIMQRDFPELTIKKGYVFSKENLDNANNDLLKQYPHAAKDAANSAREDFAESASGRSQNEIHDERVKSECHETRNRILSRGSGFYIQR